MNALMGFQASSEFECNGTLVHVAACYQRFEKCLALGVVTETAHPAFARCGTEAVEALKQLHEWMDSDDAEHLRQAGSQGRRAL